ncbi:MAG: CarD family transcriptional regulator [Rhodobiaceae bacterium]|jgi:CarD family transcriptional regulator|nr:CarD family transcriptional regulator [Rhodobiaceae bacterium]
MATAKKPAAKKPAAKKPAAKKPAAKKPATKKPVAKKPAATPAAAKKAAPKASAKKAAPKASPKKPAASKSAPKATAKKKPAKPEAPRRSALGFKVNEFVVYPAHGVGQITEIAVQEIAGMSLDLFVVSFDKEKMVLRVPLAKAKEIGMRKLADAKVMDGAIKTLKGRARVKRTMWSRRAQEYEAKINSGDLVAITEVVRDLFRNENQPEQSYSERQLYEKAIERMAREVATVEKTTDDEAIIKLEGILAKTTGGARRQPGVDPT